MAAANSTPPNITGNDRRRLWSKVQIGGADECWPWQAYRNACGYGVFSFMGKACLAHVAVYFVATQKWPAGACVLHKCDNPCCCNPSHLWLGTHQENMMDRDTKRRGGAALRRGERNGLAKLTTSQVQEIRRLHSEATLRTSQIAARFSIHPATVRKIVRGTLRNYG